MSLLTDSFEACVMMDKRRMPDGYGGYEIIYVESMPFEAAVTFDTSIEARVADASGVHSLYTVTTGRAMTLEYHDIFKRLSDGKVFRVTSDGDDRYTPKMATLDMRQVTAEEYSIGQVASS